MMKEIRILVLVIVCCQFVDFSYSYSFCLKMQSILVTVTVIVHSYSISYSNDVCFTRTLYHHYYAHAYTVPNASSLHQPVYEYTIPTYFGTF